MTLHKRLAATMSKSQKKMHVIRLRANARDLEKKGLWYAASILRKGAEQFEEEHRLTNKRRVEWLT